MRGQRRRARLDDRVAFFLRAAGRTIVHFAGLVLVAIVHNALYGYRRHGYEEWWDLGSAKQKKRREEREAAHPVLSIGPNRSCLEPPLRCQADGQSRRRSH